MAPFLTVVLTFLFSVHFYSKIICKTLSIVKFISIDFNIIHMPLLIQSVKLILIPADYAFHPYFQSMTFSF